MAQFARDYNLREDIDEYRKIETKDEFLITNVEV